MRILKHHYSDFLRNDNTINHYFRGTTTRPCGYRWHRSRNKPSSTEAIETLSWLAESAWRSTLLGYGDVPSQGGQGVRRKTTHAVPFPLEQKHYPHTTEATWHTRDTQQRLQIAASSLSLFLLFSHDSFTLSSSLTPSRLEKFCIRSVRSILV